MIAFINEFLSYVLIFVIFVITMFVAGFVGIKIRKSQDAKKALEVEATNEN